MGDPARRVRALLCGLLGALLAPTLTSAQEPNPERTVTTVILVRHAEKAGDGPSGDVPLTRDGEVRAKLLAEMTAAIHVDGLVATPFLRTQQTLTPLALQKGLQIDIVPIGGKTIEGHAQDIVDHIEFFYRGRTVVVASHSNVVPVIVEALGAGTVPDMPDEEYDHLYIVTMPAYAPPKLLHLKYGIPEKRKRG